MEFKGTLIVVKDCNKALKFYQDMVTIHHPTPPRQNVENYVPTQGMRQGMNVYNLPPLLSNPTKCRYFP